MRLAAILSETWRNLTTGTTRALLFSLTLALTAATLLGADVAAIAALRADAEHFRSSGAAIHTVFAPGRIEPSSCDALTSYDGIIASGALAPGEPIVLSALPGTTIPLFDVTPGIADVLNVRVAAPSGAWISDQMATRLHVTPGDALDTPSGRMQITGLFAWPEDGRDSRLGYAVLAASSTAIALDECWASAWPTSATTDNLLRSAVAVDGHSTSPLVLSQVNKSLGATFDGYSDYHARITRIGWIPISVVAALLGYTAVRLRRLEYAGALHSGARKAAVLATAALETFVWASVAAIVGAATLAITAARYQEPPDSLLLTEIAGILVPVAGALVGAAAAVAPIRERTLFRYFKDR